MNREEELTPLSPAAPKIVRVSVIIEDALTHAHTTEESVVISRRCANRHTRTTARLLAKSAFTMLDETTDVEPDPEPTA